MIKTRRAVESPVDTTALQGDTSYQAKAADQVSPSHTPFHRLQFARRTGGTIYSKDVADEKNKSPIDVPHSELQSVLAVKIPRLGKWLELARLSPCKLLPVKQREG